MTERLGATDGLQEFQSRDRRRRHCAGDVGHPGPFDERARRDLGQRTRGDRETDFCRRCREGRRHHLRQGSIVRRRRSIDARSHEPSICRYVESQRRRGRQPDAVRPEPQVLAGVSRDRDQRQAMGRRDQRACARWWLRIDAVLPLPGSPRTIPRPGSGCPK